MFVSLDAKNITWPPGSHLSAITDGKHIQYVKRQTQTCWEKKKKMKLLLLRKEYFNLNSSSTVAKSTHQIFCTTVVFFLFFFLLKDYYFFVYFKIKHLWWLKPMPDQTVSVGKWFICSKKQIGYWNYLIMEECDLAAVHTVSMDETNLLNIPSSLIITCNFTGIIN